MLFLFGESLDSLSGSTSKDANLFMEAFDYAIFGAGFRIALGPFKILWRNSKWRRSCLASHEFAERYVQKAVEYRQLRDTETDIEAFGTTTTGHPNLLYSMAKQTGDRVQLRNEILQALMAAQETTAVLISNVFFLLSRHPSVWDTLRGEALSLNDSQLEMDTLLHMKNLQYVLNEGEPSKH